MLVATITEVVDAEDLRLEPIRVGRVPPGRGTPDRYVSVTDGDVRLLRVDVYSFGPDCFAFQDAIIWQGNVVVGFGSHVHVIGMADRSSVTIELGSYYGHVSPTADYLLIASGERLFRLAADRSLVWTSDVLGIDGVVVHEAGADLIQGDGEWDPPGGWEPFTVSARDGKRLT